MKKLILFATILLASPLWGGGIVTAQTANEPGSGNALIFDGVNDWINIPNATSLNFGTSNFSAECWFIVNSLGNGPGILGEENTGAGNPQWYIRERFSDGTLEFITEDGGGNIDLFSNQKITTNVWTHVAVIRQGNTLFLYINGELDNILTGLSVQDVSSPGPVVIGKLGTGTAYLDGQIDEVRIWNRALTQTEIQTNMCKKLPDNYGNGLVGYWRFDEGVDNTCTGGQDACDASGNGNNGVKF